MTKEGEEVSLPDMRHKFTNIYFISICIIYFFCLEDEPPEGREIYSNVSCK